MLGLDRVFLAGLSLGGWIAAQVAVLACSSRSATSRDQGLPWLERGCAVVGMKTIIGFVNGTGRARA